MESAPSHHRGLLSGLMQAGYPLGYLLAAVGIELVLPHWGWRAMFAVGVPVAVLTIGLAWKAPESVAWRKHQQSSIAQMFPILWEHRKRFVYLLLVMVGMASLSHGTQDLYPDFLKSVRGLTRSNVSQIAILYNICAISGALFFGRISELERIGRRRSIILALCLSASALYPWAFVAAPGVLLLGACLMQAGVQGAFGIIPAHLNELAPDRIRSLFPGFVYQLGVLIASPAVSIQYALRNRLGYSWALALFESIVILSLIILFACGPERKGRNFHA
jgi:SHS family lactate transporter-like MFS transporter